MCEFVQALLPLVRPSRPIPFYLLLPMLRHVHRQNESKFSDIVVRTPASLTGVGVDQCAVSKSARVLHWALHVPRAVILPQARLKVRLAIPVSHQLHTRSNFVSLLQIA